jgi:hypothetical protein
MKKYLNKQFRTAFLGSLGTILSVMVVQMMIVGDLQKIVKFRGVGEEMVFTLFATMIGVIMLALTVSAFTRRG